MIFFGDFSSGFITGFPASSYCCIKFTDGTNFVCCLFGFVQFNDGWTIFLNVSDAGAVFNPVEYEKGGFKGSFSMKLGAHKS